MEAIAVGASVIAIIQMADRIIGLCKYYIQTAHDAPSDLRTIFIETSAIKATLESLEYLDKHDSSNRALAKNICGSTTTSPIEGCYQTLAALEKLFLDDKARSTEWKKNKRMMLDSILTSLAWPLKETKARKLLEELRRYKTTINLALTTEIAQDVRWIREKTSGIHDMLTESQTREVYTWLQHTDPSPVHNRACKNYEPETGTWIWQNPQWTEWLACKHRAIHIHGIPGAGKTVLMSYLIQQISKHCEQNSNRDCVYVYYYCYFAHKQDESKPFLKWLVSRLCREAGGIPRYISDLSRRGAEPSPEDLLEAIAQLLSLFETVFVAIDAIDESNNYNELLNILQTLATDLRFQRLQIVTSARQYRDIEQAMRSISQMISMSNPFVEQDIRYYVQSTLKKNSHFHKWPQDLLNEVKESLATGASGMFRWAVCQIDIIRRLKYERRIIQMALRTLPKTLYDTYDRIVQIYIPEEDRLFVYYTLQWIVFRNELSVGKAFPYLALIGAAEKSILRLTGSESIRLYDRDRLADVCGCLINIGSLRAFATDEEIDEDTGDANDGVIFAHYSVQEYLESNLDLSSIFGHPLLIGQGLRLHLLDTTLAESQQLAEDKLSNISSSFLQADTLIEDEDVILSSCHDFSIYTVVLAIASLYTLCDDICQNEALKALAIDSLNPSKPHYRIMKRLMLALENEGALGIFNTSGYFLDFDIGAIEWGPKSEKGVEHLCHLLLLAQDRPESLSLAKSFLDGKDHKSLLQTRISFSMQFFTNFSVARCIFSGSCIEAFAPLAFHRFNTFQFLMEISADLFDPSAVLARYVGGSKKDSERHHSHHPVQRLLDLGADPNLKAYKVTPLQIASLTGDFVAVEALLRAGAQPNSTGTPDGITWEHDTLIHNYLHGASPLSICRSFDVFLTDPEERDTQKTEKLLLGYGAEDFVLSSCEVPFANKDSDLLLWRNET